MNDFGVVSDSRPIMVSGVYRSGTTFLTALLGAHPKLKASSSTVKFLRFCLGRYGDVREPENRRRLVAETHKRVKVRWGLSIDEEAILARAESHGDVTYARLYDVIMKDMLTDVGDNSQRWVEKLAVQWEDIPHFLDMFPQGRVIHIFRDPRDVAASYKNMTFEPGFTYLDAAFNFRGAHETLDRLSNQYSDRIMIVKAEEVAQAPEKAARAICRFLDLDYQASMIDARQLHSEGEDWASNTSYDKPYRQLPDATPRWPQQLSRAEVIFIEMVTQPYFERLGYQSANYFPSPEEWSEVYGFIGDPLLRERFGAWLSHGRGAQGYRTDPYTHEMRIVFPERYAND
jgi:hypothetical protein